MHQSQARLGCTRNSSTIRRIGEMACNGRGTIRKNTGVMGTIDILNGSICHPHGLVVVKILPEFRATHIDAVLAFLRLL